MAAWRAAWMGMAMLALAGIASAVSADVVRAGGGGIVFSSHCDGFVGKVPDGWVLDTRAAASQGVDMLLYPDGADPSDLNALQVYTYVMPSVKRVAGQQDDLSVDILEGDALADYRKHDPAATLQSLAWADPVPRSARRIQLYDLQAPRMRKHERIAYVENEAVIFAVALSATSPALLEQHADVVQSIASSGLILTGSRKDGRCMLPENAGAR